MQENDYFVLKNINSPADVKALDESMLPELCSELRGKMVETVSLTGGHLASSLGTVELTVALHRSFNSPEDKIVWDVGHQAYAHKLLTGRYGSFSTLRTEGGISGFVRPDESIHDSFYEGHAGTSVSQAAGVALANKIKGSKNYSVAVIGDGSFGNGMVYEALNHAGSTDSRLIVILNDNEMSISENVGAMARYLANVRAKPEYYRFKAKVEKALKRVPLIGNGLSNFVFKVKSRVKNLIFKSSFFEDLGFMYVGPIDGHDISKLCDAMENAKLQNRPVVIHINTIKGKGYDYAESHPEKFHGISRFNIETGEPNSSGINYSTAFANALTEFAKKDKRICAVTAAMKLGTGLENFFDEFPGRSFDVGIAEEHAVTFCSGLSAGGMLPVFAVYSTFLQRCADQLIHDGALQRRKMIIAVDRAGFVGEDGETHQGLFDVSLVQSIPNVTVYSPATYEGLSKALYNAFYKDDNLVVIRYPRGIMPEESVYKISGDDCEIFEEDNKQNVIVTYGRLWFEAEKAATVLKEQGISVSIIKLNRIKPVPGEAIENALKFSNVFFFEEGMSGGGVGEKFGEKLLEKKFGGNYSHIAVNDEFVSHASVRSQMKKYKLDSESMVDIIKGGNEI